MTEEIFFSDNIKCGGCANSIKTAMLNIEGIENATVSVEEGSVALEYVNEEAKFAALSKLSNMGYPERGTSTAFQKGKSYVQCMIGRVTEKK